MSAFKGICSIGCHAAFAFLLLFCGSRAQAQVLYGSIRGVVLDDAGSSVPLATVRLKNADTGQTREAVTDQEGNYGFPSLSVGSYEINVIKEGFQTFATRGVNLTAGDQLRVDATLRIGAVQQTVEVSSQAAVLQTDSAEVRTEISAQNLASLPVPVGRNYQNLLVTVPGVSPPTNQHSVAANPSRGLTFNVNGTTRNSNNVRIDGALANNVWLPHVTAYVPALEAIEAVSVVTASSDATQGIAGGSAVNVQIKNGTNDFRGSLFEYHTNNRLKAKPFFLPAGQGKPKLVNNQFGGTIGGPIRRNKLFFFGSWESTYDHQAAATFATVPTAAMRRGDFSSSATPVYDPQTGAADGTGRSAFAGNQIPASRISPIAARLAALTPLPTFPNLLANNYYATGSYNVNRHKLDGKVTFVATDKLNLSGRIGWLKYGADNPPVFGEAVGGSAVSSAGGRAGRAFGNVYSMTYSAAYTVSPTFVIDSYVGTTLSGTNHDPIAIGTNVGLDTLGIPGTNGGGTNPLASGWPVFIVNSFTDLGTPQGSTPIRYDDTQFEYTANATWIKSSHTLRFGVDLSRYAINHYEAISAAGVFTFTGGTTTLRGGPTSNQFNSYASFLLGLPYTVATESLPFNDNRINSRQRSVTLYAQDQWQARKNLTVGLGIRWDYFPMGNRLDRGLERYNFETNQMQICGVAGLPIDCGYHINQKNFSPILGIAYRPNEATVIRTGYGINYDPYPLSFVRNMLTNYPNDILLTVIAPDTFQAARTLESGIPPIVVPDISSGVIAVPNTYAVRSLPQNVQRGYIQSWNFSVQRQLPGAFVAQAGYVGTRQVKITQRLDLNAGQVLGAGSAGQPFNRLFGRTVPTELLTPVGHNTYDSLQATLQRRFAAGVGFNMSYTWSKALGICCDDLSDSPPAIQIPAYQHLARSLMPFDRTHNFTTSVVLELPFGRGKRMLSSGVGSLLAGGWQTNWLLSRYSGTPFSVSAAGTSLNATGNTQRADQVKSDVQILGGTGPNQYYFDPLAFAPVTTARFGTAGYNSLRGPGTFNLDFGIFRTFRFSERWDAQFRAEALNLTNTPHFANPNANVSNLQLNPDGSIRNLGGYSTITSTTGTGREGIDERLIRLGLKISF